LKKRDEIIIQVEDFIKQINDGTLTLTHEAQNIKMTKVIGKDALGRPIKEQQSLADLISREITNYQKVKSIHVSKSKLPSFQDGEIKVFRSKVDLRLRKISQVLLGYIELARIRDVLKNQNLSDKIQVLEEQNKKLKEEKDKFEKECERLTEINEELHKALDKFGQRTSNAEKEKE
jgi:DNA-binding transcriptional MerR regulator